MNGADELIYHFETSTKKLPPTLNELRRKERNVLKELKQNGATFKKDLLIIEAKENSDERTYLEEIPTNYSD